MNKFKINTQEQSIKLQEILFKMGYGWTSRLDKFVTHEDKRYLFINSDNKQISYASWNNANYFMTHSYKELKTEQFITMNSQYLPNISIVRYEFVETTEESKFWGYHLMLDCGGCDTTTVSSEYSIKRFFAKLVEAINMEPVGPTIMKYTCKDDPKEGWTAVQVIVTSSITGHFMNSGSCYLDVFSCKEFDIEVVKTLVKDCFEPERLRVNYITRDAN